MDKVDLTVLCSGSALLDRFGRVVDLVRADGFNVTDELYTMVEGNEPINMAHTMANTVQLTASALRHLQPDVIVTIADRYETLGTATAAAYLGIPLVHIQGGEITGNIDERVRHAITKLSDLHLVSGNGARNRLIRMGEHPDAVIVTGCPSIDLARESADISIAAVQLETDKRGSGARVDLGGDYVIVMLHSETESYEDSFERTKLTLSAVAALGLPMVVFWPNPDAGSDAISKAIRLFREQNNSCNSVYLKNIEGHLFLRLLQNARCLVGNSSVGIREGAYLGVPVVNIGDRQFGRDRASNVIDANWDIGYLNAALHTQINAPKYATSHLYGDGYAGAAIARALITPFKYGKKRFYE